MYVVHVVQLISENLSGITAGSPMVGTPIILVWRPINPGLIILHPSDSQCCIVVLIHFIALP